jgi:hypothetical protein
VISVPTAIIIPSLDVHDSPKSKVYSYRNWYNQIIITGSVFGQRRWIFIVQLDGRWRSLVHTTRRRSLFVGQPFFRGGRGHDGVVVTTRVSTILLSISSRVGGSGDGGGGDGGSTVTLLLYMKSIFSRKGDPIFLYLGTKVGPESTNPVSFFPWNNSNSC